jgi:glycosyltransferase involved in cell wall biosynthesis
MAGPAAERRLVTHVSVVVPVCNERESLPLLHERLVDSLAGHGLPAEIIYVDDGSTDGSWQTLCALAARDPAVRLIRFRRNFGQSAALAAGIKAARHDVVVTLDADLQNDPADIPRLLAVLEEGYDCVSGWRRDRADRWLTRRLPSKIANALISFFTGVRLRDTGCTLKAYRRAVVAEVPLYGELHRFVPALVAWVGGRITEVAVRHHPRRHGRSKYGIRRTLKVLVDVMTVKFLSDYSTKPNYVFGGFGMACMAAGTAMLAVVAHRVFFLRQLEATPLIFVMVIFYLTGVQSIFVGLLAEILVRGAWEAQGKPAYHVRETVNLDEADR